MFIRTCDCFFPLGLHKHVFAIHLPRGQNGFGLRIETLEQTLQHMIVEVLPNGSANSIPEICPGLEILKVNNVSYTGIDHNDLVAELSKSTDGVDMILAVPVTVSDCQRTELKRNDQGRLQVELQIDLVPGKITQSYPIVVNPGPHNSIAVKSGDVVVRVGSVSTVGKSLDDIVHEFQTVTSNIIPITIYRAETQSSDNYALNDHPPTAICPIVSNSSSPKTEPVLKSANLDIAQESNTTTVPVLSQLHQLPASDQVKTNDDTAEVETRVVVMNRTSEGFGLSIGSPGDVCHQIIFVSPTADIQEGKPRPGDIIEKVSRYSCGKKLIIRKKL